MGRASSNPFLKGRLPGGGDRVSPILQPQSLHWVHVTLIIGLMQSLQNE